MASVNRVTIIGNLGRDIELRTYPDGGKTCNLAVATSRKWRDKDSGDTKEETEWHRLVCNGRIAEIAAEYLRKGSPAYYEGRLRTRKWADKDGKDVYTTEIVVENLQLLGSREDKPAPAPAPRPASRSPAPPAKTGTGFDDMDDDIPF